MSLLPGDYVRNLARMALAEDVGAGDITSECAIPAEARAGAVIIAKQAGVVAGMPLVEAVFQQVDDKLKFDPRVADGEPVGVGAEVCRISGAARSILTGERIALNFLQQLSGIATLTRQFVDAVKGTGVTILDTRKTTPTLRLLEKYAVVVGGGENHRMGLFDAMMIKDNHRVVLARLGSGAIGDAVRNVRRQYPHAPVVIEADTLEQVNEALAAGADQILLDNMSCDEMIEAVRLVGGRAKTEASGGVTLATVADIARTGVDYISIGALTHSAPALDFSLDMVEQ